MKLCVHVPPILILYARTLENPSDYLNQIPNRIHRWDGIWYMGYNGVKHVDEGCAIGHPR